MYARDLTNDIVIYDYRNQALYKRSFDKSVIYVRQHHCSFMVDDCLYSVGGQTIGLKIIESDMLEINLTSFKHRYIEVQHRRLMPSLSNQKCCLVFYPSRYNKSAQ